MEPFGVGQTVQRRDVFRGRVWSSQALRVVEDTPTALITCAWPGAHVRVPEAYARVRRGDGSASREEAVRQLADGTWTLSAGEWQETVLLLWKAPGAYFSVNAFYSGGADHRLLTWYVNFERPNVRQPGGFDTFDLLVDLLIDADLTGWRWKDEDEYAHGRRLGIIDDAEHAHVDAARQQALALLAERAGPFAEAERWAAWRRDPAWPTPSLPAAQP
ncbi:MULTISPECIES: DUF402 domain-containing protein [Streptomyces]|uniref:DUF402 domain-containing protein n=1 Tax=Streptomyces TaxID=1883 RepID=UPI000E69892D|nr:MULTISPECIES: DUF402 domain-containing protein [Streptomyces]MDX3065877.1 DUF402 domain-containing protein [Streptomyces sp. ND04-05B]MDX3519474.1 DUF402 domain-containing protein [Streptomyces scabiei]